jgi:mannose-6-phosphate isomerase-like protein (cupin superfamily)
MEVFDLRGFDSSNSGSPEKELFFESDEFSARVVSLPPGAQIPPCEMLAHVLFFVMDGEVVITANSQEAELVGGKCLISEPATLSMRTDNGARILGIQVAADR